MSPARPRRARRRERVRDTSPSEWPASPRGWSIVRRRGREAPRPRAHVRQRPVPIRSSATERLRKLCQGSDPDRTRRRIEQVPPRPAADVDGEHPGVDRRPDVVVDAVSDVGDLRCGDAALGDDPLEELGRWLLDPPAGGRADQVDVLAQQILGRGERVADCPDEEALGARCVEARQSVGIEVVASQCRPRVARRRGSTRPTSDARRAPRGRPPRP